MIGSIIGDIIGSRFEFKNLNKPQYDVELFTENNFFTDDTILTMATIESIIEGIPYSRLLKEYYHRFRFYPHAGWGGMFEKWAYSDSIEPYNSYGNGCVMRIAPLAFYYNRNQFHTITPFVTCTHNHLDSIYYSKLVCNAIWDNIDNLNVIYQDNLGLDYKTLVDTYQFDDTCKGSVPQALYIASIAESFEDGMRKALTIGGDTDTICCIVGGILEAKYTIPTWMILKAMEYLPIDFRENLTKFYEILNKYK